MKFGPLSPRAADGAIAVHSIRQGGLVLRRQCLAQTRIRHRSEQHRVRLFLQQHRHKPVLQAQLV
ncbi:MAG: hypothetical protein HY056_14585, partial [Proteobacteria bacterium]|nr:hypothetical protein [Pseudomonadota bacterium]